MTTNSEHNDSIGASKKGNIGHTAFNLLTALRQQGCPVCRLVRAGVQSYLDSISYENVNDPGIRGELREALGYCAVHGQEWLGRNDTLGTALIYRDVLDEALRRLRSYTIAPVGDGPGQAEIEEAGLIDRLQNLLGNRQFSSDTGRAIAAELEPRGPCPACLHSQKLEDSMLASFAEGFAHAEFREAYRQHEMGLCLPHFRQALRRISRARLIGDLVRAQAAKLAVTGAALAEVIRKYDYRYAGEAHGNEFKAPALSVQQAGGALPTQLNLPVDNTHQKQR